MNSTHRDIQLDIYRALAMIYIVCVIHTMYWFGYSLEPLKSLLLFEMPMMFFISGAAYSMQTQRKKIFNIIASRVRRIVLPFYIFLFVLFFLLIFGFFEANIYSFSKHEIIKLFATGGSNKLPYYGYTWFISVYLIITCSLPIQQRIMERTRRYVYILMCLSPCIVISFVTFPIADWFIKELFVYNFFFVLGYLYYRNISNKLLLFILIITLFIVIYGFIDGIMIPMQDNKFPPNIYFLIFSLSALCIISILFGKIKFRNNYLLRLWNKRGYTIYLYQCVSHYIVFLITKNWIISIHSETAVFIIYFIITLCVATILSYFTYPFERLLIKVFQNIS